MYLIIDRDYRLYQNKIFTGYMRAQVKKGNLSVVNIRTMEGMNIDGWTMEKIDDWDDRKPLDDEPLVSVD